jgi:hypothetical protein
MQGVQGTCQEVLQVGQLLVKGLSQHGDLPVISCALQLELRSRQRL